jgi:transcriptional regulator with XRE-family HTH domain
MSNGNEIWGMRLKKARLSAALSQKQLGIQAGLDEFVAGTRINRYEGGVHKADYQIAQRLAEVLDVPTAYFYAEDDVLAELMLIYHRLGGKKKSELLKVAKGLQA